MEQEFAFIITTDHLAEEYPDAEDYDDTNKVWYSLTPDGSKSFGMLSEGIFPAQIHPVHSSTFYAYDDDGEKYYTGKLFWRGDEPTVDTLYQVLATLSNHAGVTRVNYPNHPEYDIG